MVFRLKYLVLSILTLFIIGCGGGSSSTTKNKEPIENTVSDKKIVGYLVDAPIVNMSYQCGGSIGRTGLDGRFECSSMPINFTMGDIVVGSLDEMTEDGKVYPQDLVGVDRSEVSNPIVLRIASFLQSLDDNGDISTTITISDSIHIAGSGNLQDMTQEEAEELLREAGITPVSLADAEEHLRDNLGISTEGDGSSSGTVETEDNATSGETTSNGETTGIGGGTTTITPTPTLNAPILANTTAVVAIQGTTIANITFSNTGGAVATCSVTPALPTGLAIANSCTISGTPTEVTAQTTYTVTGVNATGSNTATVDITVNAIPIPNVADTTAPVAVKDVAITDIIFANTGGTIASCTVSPILPTGLTIADDCTISGTPTAVTAEATYTVTAINSTGSDTATVDITVNATLLAPVVADATASVATKGTAITDITFVNTGGAASTCTVLPTLPTGLTIANDCTISGTPTVVTAQATYTITATNATGSDTATVDITVNPIAPIVADATAVVAVNGTAITDIVFSNTGGAITTCTVAPSLPTGLNIANDCTISGTPTVVTAQATYTVTATNITGTDTVTVDITVNPIAPIVADATAVVAVDSTAIADITFVNTGGAITTCTVAPSLPTGLDIANDCTISGTPTVVTAQATYTITATNVTGSDTATVDITVNPIAPIVADATAMVAVDSTAIADITFVNTGGAITTCTVAPSLPTGLDIANNCTISGTPTVVTAQATYTITATNVTGSDTATVDITVNPKAPILANGVAQTYPKDTAITTLVFSNSGGEATSCSISPSLPVGLEVGLNNNTCEITGTPTAITAEATYTVTATNVTGDNTATVDITISDAAPSLADVSTQSYPKDTAITALVFTNTGGAVTSCTVSPSLPAGLDVGLNNDTCEITGTPTAITVQATYTVTGTNGTGDDTATVDITISDAIPSLADSTAQSYPKGTTITTLAFSNSGGVVTSCSVSPDLPAGLDVGLNNDTCEITGTPTAITAQATYTITGTNDTGNDTATVDITISDAIPNLADATEQTYTKGAAITALVFANSGGAVTSCTVSPDLPAGLDVGVNSDTCEITGTPTAITAQTTYTVTGTNGTGDDTATVDITVSNDADGDYIPDNIEAMLGMSSSNSDEDGDGILDGLQLTGDKGDNFFDKQWHIRSTGANSSPNSNSATVEGNDLGVMDIYHAYMGYNEGSPVVVQVVDTGVDADHEDLVDNMDLSLSRNSDTEAMGDPVETDTSSHGTMCAGIIGARGFNGKGVRGVAPFAKIAGSNWLSYQSTAELEEAWTKNDSDGKIILSSNSWGSDSASPNTYYESLMAYAADNLRKVDGVAKGKLFIKAAGNGRGDNHDSGLSYASSNPYVITVAGLMSDNTHASYSSPGSNILVSGYSGDYYQNSATIGTTYIATRSALEGDLTYNSTKHCYERSSDNECSMPTWDADNSGTKSYTYGMNGTSAATPTVAGSLALVLEACPSLPWRDVKYLVAKSAIKVDAGNASWVTNGAGLHHSVDYGFGLINPSAMINECKSGYTELTASSAFTESFDPDPDIAIPDNDATGISYDFTVVGNKVIEWIGVTITSNHANGGNLEIYLTSPSGTTTRLMKGNNSGGAYSLAAGFRYGSVAFIGESTVGTWTIKIADIADGDTGNLESLTFTLFGH